MASRNIRTASFPPGLSLKVDYHPPDRARGEKRMSRRTVFVCCDGLGRNWIAPERTPVLDALRRKSLWCDDHRAVFPSVTRASAASVTTGCHPARHGLHGNRMGLF